MSWKERPRNSRLGRHGRAQLNEEADVAENQANHKQ